MTDKPTGRRSNGNPVDAIAEAAPWMRLAGGRISEMTRAQMLDDKQMAEVGAPRVIRIPAGHAAFIYPIPADPADE